MANVQLGKVGLTPKDLWSSSLEYEKLDIVVYDGESYIAKKNVPIGVSVTTGTEYWQLFSEKGNGMSVGKVISVTTTQPLEAENKLWIREGYDEEFDVLTPDDIDDTAGEGDIDKLWSAGKTWNEIDIFKKSLGQMADIPDNIRNNNLAAIAQYTTQHYQEGVTILPINYSGVKLSGTLQHNKIIAISKPYIVLEAGKEYTFITFSEDKLSRISIGLRDQDAHDWVKDLNNSSIYGSYKFTPIYFIPKQTYNKCYLTISNYTGNTVTFSNPYYIYVIEGHYTLEDFSNYKKQQLIIEQYIDNEIKLIKSNNKWNKLEYKNLSIYKDYHFMDANGDAVFVPEHCVLEIKEPGNICKIKFKLNSLTSYPLFIIKNKNGELKKIFSRSFNSAFLQNDLYFVIPGGLDKDTILYMNWYYKNSPEEYDRVLDHIYVQYENNKNNPKGKDLFDIEEALSSGPMYFAYDSGLQQISTTYCAGELKVKAGDIISSYRNCHIACYDKYGNYISGTASTQDGYYTYIIPENTNGAMISFRISEANQFYIGVNEHFTIPINQNIITHKANSADYIDNENEIINVNSIIKFPMNYLELGEPTPLIVIFHGSGFGISETNWGYTTNGVVGTSNPFNTLITKFIQNGYAVCDINGFNNTYPNNTWGSQRGILAYRKLIDYVLTKYNLQKMINIYAFSMGGLVALNFLNMNRDIIKCAAIASPVVSLHEQAYSDNNWKAQIKTSYGFAEGTEWENNIELTKGYDPFDRIININEKEYDISNYPFMRIWHGTNDTISPLLSLRLSEAIRNGGHDCTYRTVNGAGHEICYGQNNICNNEYIYWFNRFNKENKNE